MDFLKKQPKISILLTDCLSQPYRQIEDNGKDLVVNTDRPFYGPCPPHSRIDTPIPLLEVGQPGSHMRNELRILQLIYKAQAARVPHQDRLMVTCVRDWPK